MLGSRRGSKHCFSEERSHRSPSCSPERTAPGSNGARVPIFGQVTEISQLYWHPPPCHRQEEVSRSMPRRVHYAWVVLGVLIVIMIAAGGLRSAFGVFIKPIEAELGWSRTALSIAAALSLLLYGALAPFAGRAADLWGARTVFTASLGLMAVGALASAYMTRLWHLYLASGILMA